MAEEVKKAPRPVDPNSAKYKLGKIAADAFVDAIEAKKNGIPVAWVSSNFPVEIPETLGIATVYPENQAAGIAARGAGERMCNVAEADGYSNDICAYARISMAYAKLKSCPEQDVAMPDVVLCCNNICNCMIKWYENLAQELNVPMIMLDIPFNPDYDVSDALVQYVSAQFWDVVHQLESLFHLKWDDDKFQQVTGFSCRASRAWLAATGCAKYVPSPFNGFDLLNHMAVMVTARGKECSGDAMETLYKEYMENHKNGTSTFRTEEKYRILFEGIACWPYLRATSTGLKSRGINMVTTIYADAFGYDYDSFEGMIKAYCSVPNAINLEKSRDKRIKLCKDNHVEGMLIHTNRSCKLWSGFMYEMGRQVGKACDIPVASFDGDQADPRNFSEAQYDTRVQGLMEIMEANKEQKGANTMKRRKKRFVLPLCLLLLLSLCAPAYAAADAPFADIHGHWAECQMTWAQEAGILTGTSSTTLSPDDTATRAMAVTVLYRYAGSPAVEGTSGFADVPADAYYADGVAWCVQAGLITGKTETAFRPGTP